MDGSLCIHYGMSTPTAGVFAKFTYRRSTIIARCDYSFQQYRNKFVQRHYAFFFLYEWSEDISVKAETEAEATVARWPVAGS
jgi:hypothetical protein